MTRRPRSACALLLTLAPAAAGAIEEPKLAVTVAPASATIGDPIVVTLTLRLPASSHALAATFPDWGESWGDATVLAASAVARREEGETTVLEEKVELAAYRTGSIPLPPRSLRLDGSPPRALSTPPELALEIRSVLPPGAAEPAPRPPDPPRSLPVPNAFAWTAATLVATALAAAIALRRRRAAGASTRATVAALAPLAELERALGSLAEQAPTAAFTALSLALRRFLGRSFAFPAAESTTSELARRVDRRGLDRDLVKGLVRLLREADGVKFARQPADSGAVERGCRDARSLALAVDRHLHPPTPEGSP